jgi:Rhodopirellula transposase DDE domain
LLGQSRSLGSALLAYGWGGVTAVSGATGMSPNTIRKGVIELAARQDGREFEVSTRLRKPGGGRKRLTETSKWNKIEHRMFSHITQNWRGRPLISHEVIVNLIANTTTRTGLKIRAELATASMATGTTPSRRRAAKLDHVTFARFPSTRISRRSIS